MPVHIRRGGDSTIEVKGTRAVAVKGCSSIDGDKRMCTIQMCIRPFGAQPAVALLFRGQGRFLNSEKSLYDPRVHVYDQQKHGRIARLH